MSHDLSQVFAILLKKYGSHCQAARSLGITPDHYRKIRNGRANIPPRTADYILFKASSPPVAIPPSLSTPEGETLGRTAP
jgi:hypothetical protein